jgi:hypothetical protein
MWLFHKFRKTEYFQLILLIDELNVRKIISAIMKKFILSLLLLFCMVSFGSYAVSVAHAQTMSPADAAQLNQELTGLKARLLDLQAQANAPAAPASTETLSAQDIASLGTALQALNAALAALNQTIAANPARFSAQNRASIAATLGNMSVSLLAMNQALGGSPASSNVATAAPSAASPVVAQAGPAAAQPEPAVNNAANGNVVAQTAQASSAVPLGRGWMITFGVIILAIIVLPFLRGRKRQRAVATVAANRPQNQPEKPASVVAQATIPAVRDAKENKLPASPAIPVPNSIDPSRSNRRPA